MAHVSIFVFDYWNVGNGLIWPKDRSSWITIKRLYESDALESGSS